MRFRYKHEPPLQGFTNPSMQIHVQNEPFVYNPDTISLGLGFTKGKKMTGGIQYIKNISRYGVQFVFYPPLPLYITLHQRAGLAKKLKEVCFRKN